MRHFTFILAILMFSVNVVGSPINDVPKNDGAYNSVKSVVDSGLMSVYSDGNFYGNRSLTRKEMAVILDNVLRRVDQNESQLSKSDIQQLIRLSRTFKGYLSDLESTQARHGEKIRLVEDEQKVLHHDLTELNDKFNVESSQRAEQQWFLWGGIALAAILGITVK